MSDNENDNRELVENEETQNLESDNEDEEYITPQKVLENIENAWMNEKSSPDILPYQEEMLELMLGQLTHMEENLKKLPNNDFRKVTHQMEIERIRYIIVSYLRTRLQKIEEFTQYILDEEDKRSSESKRLSNHERKFAEDYLESVEGHFHQLVLRHIPPNQDDKSKRIIRPNLMSNVFLKVKKDCGVVVNTNDEEINLSEGSQHILPYQLVAKLITNGDIQLL